MGVHPLAPLVQIEAERIFTGATVLAHFRHGLHVGLGRPVAMHIDGDRGPNLVALRPPAAGHESG